MSLVPIVPHWKPDARASDVARVEELAEQLLEEQPRLRTDPRFAAVRPKKVEDVPTLHIDDFSDITVPEYYGTIYFLEDRARLRAGDGDWIATRSRPAEGYEAYCRDQLALGDVRWLRVRASKKALATSCWVDRATRRTLTRAVRQDRISCIHPHMGSFAVWALASLLERTTRRSLSVLAPPPNLTRAVNDKLWFTDVVRRLLGEEWVPHTMKADNSSSLASVVRQLARDSGQIVVKLTDSVGGGGNLVLDATHFRGLPLGRIRADLKAWLEPFEWHGQVPILAGRWETEVLSTPSVQTWIPPEATGLPQMEGVYDQLVEGKQGMFVGNVPARLPRDLSQELVDRSWLLARLFQRLGYVGRCSFDLILVGSSHDECRAEFVECNGRWGGTSLPMTLMNRLFGDWATQPYWCRDLRVMRWQDPSFEKIESELGSLLYQQGGPGSVVLFNPGALTRGEIGVIGLGGDLEEARSNVEAAFGADPDTQAVPPSAITEREGALARAS